ncbi:pyrroline-5-carboxylate reductase [Chloroflexota bacterium]
MKIAFIGGGSMGEAMLAALLDKRLALPDDVSVSDISDDRCQYLKQKYGVEVTSNNKLAAVRGEVIILAVKPQHLTEAITELKGQLGPDQLVMSIIAGAEIKTLTAGLSYSSVVRVMPNAPAQIGGGMSMWTATVEVTPQQKEQAGSILGAVGREIYVDDEKYLDMATAVSGSGPAYFFLFVEALVDAAVGIGLSRDMAEEMVLQTMLGSGRLIQESGKSPAELRRMVTSPGGTTAEALLEFEKGGFNDMVKRAVKAAYEKAKSLGGEQK